MHPRLNIFTLKSIKRLCCSTPDRPGELADLSYATPMKNKKSSASFWSSGRQHRANKLFVSGMNFHSHFDVPPLTKYLKSTYNRIEANISLLTCKIAYYLIVTIIVVVRQVGVEFVNGLS